MVFSGKYELLMQCFLSGQMTQARLDRHMQDDEVFKSWVSRYLAKRDRN